MSVAIGHGCPVDGGHLTVGTEDTGVRHPIRNQKTRLDSGESAASK